MMTIERSRAMCMMTFDSSHSYPSILTVEGEYINDLVIKKTDLLRKKKLNYMPKSDRM